MQALSHVSDVQVVEFGGLGAGVGNGVQMAILGLDVPEARPDPDLFVGVTRSAQVLRGAGSGHEAGCGRAGHLGPVEGHGQQDRHRAVGVAVWLESGCADS